MGKAQGLLAYIDDKPVGWCNAQPRANFANMRYYTIAVTDANEPVGSIMCFLVTPEHRGKGVCTALLNAAVTSSTATGYRQQKATLPLILLSGVGKFRGRRRTTKDL